MIYFLLPTRGRPDMLRRSVNSLFENARDPYGEQTYKLLIACDPDDRATIELVQPWHKHDNNLTHLWVTPERFGYSQLHCYYNGLCEQVQVEDQDIIVLWNDDAVMRTKDWDVTLQQTHGLLLDLQSELSPIYVAFPGVRGSLYKALGHYSGDNPHVDSYLQDIGRALGIVQSVDVVVHHDRPDITGRQPDSTYIEGRAGLSHKQYFAPEYQAVIAESIERVRKTLCL